MLKVPFSSDHPALKSRWGDAKSRWGDASLLQFKYWFGDTPRRPPNGPPEINFLNGLTLGASFLDISRYLTDKYFDIVPTA